MTDSQVLMIVGSQWGDEGKGKLVDYLSDKVDVCARCQGGDNAGHTIVANGVKFDFHILPSGVIHEQCVNIIGNGCVVYIPGFFNEIEKTESKGVNTANRIFVSDRAHVVFDIHQIADGLNEQSLGGSNIGTTKRGIGPTYTSKAARSGVRLGDLKFDGWKQKLRNLADNYKLKFGDSFNVDIEAEITRYEALAKKILPHVTDTVYYINKAYKDGKKILIEGANAIMLDLDYGTYPYVTSSSTGCGGATTGLGLSPNKIHTRYGVVKAYTTRVGSGPFPTEQLNEFGERMQTVGFEVGTTTGRKRRCGWLDLVLLRYSHLLNDYTALCLTKLDVLTGFDELLVGVGYVLDGEEIPSFPANLEDLARVEVTYKTFPGWKEDITNARSYSDLPVAAQNYVKFIEEFIGAPVSWIGVGPAREAMIDRTSK